MHGAPPNDFPKGDLGEFFSLHNRLTQGCGQVSEAAQSRYNELEARVRMWPRTPQNDPYYAAAFDLAAHLRQATDLGVVVGFNEFCSPTLDEALDRAALEGSDKIVVVTPMMTRGGGHSEKDIPKALQRARERHPGVDFIYAWPFEVSDIARFLSAQIRIFLEKDH